MKAFTIIILATLSINLSAQLEVNSSGKVGIKTTPTLGTLEVGNINGYNLSGTFIGAEFRIGRYTSGWNMGFVQARDNTNNEIGLRFRTQKAGGTITNAMHIYPDGHVSFYEPVYFRAGHSNISSDERFKKDIKNLEKTEIHKLYSLNGKEYTRIFQIADTAETSEAKEITEYGLIAQELKEIYPKLVTINEDGFYSIKYTALIPIIIEEEISKLIYHIGLGVSMHWAAYTNYSGTYGSADGWASVFSNNLGYKSTWVFWNDNEIHANPNAFKAALRNNLNDGLPILFRVGGHAIVVDGFEDEVYFHGAYGRGGFTDGYYYLFIDDADGVHITLPTSTFYQAVLDLEPDYSFPVDLSIDTTISDSTTTCYQALNSVSFSSVIEGNGSSGANIAIYANKVTLNPGFEIEKGGTLYINNENY